MAGCPFIVIEFPHFDVVVPLVCRLCGNCCRNCYVAVDPESLPEIARVTGESIHAIQDRLNQGLAGYRQGNPPDCCFLADNRCLIHEVKPEACRQFPSFTDAAAGSVECPAHREHKRIEQVLRRRYTQLQIRPPSSSRKHRQVPDEQWQELLGIVERQDVSAKFLRAFMLLNKAEPGNQQGAVKGR